MADPICKDPNDPLIIPWPARIRRTGELKVFAGPSFTGSVYATDLDKAITTINQLLKGKVGLVFKKADKEANSEIVAETFPGSDLHGRARLTVMGSGDRRRLDLAKLRVPATPKVLRVNAGQPVRLHILVHELIHCIGLGDCAHSNNDVFIAKLVITIDSKDPPDGSGSIPPLKIGADTLMRIKKAWEGWIYVDGMDLVRKSGEEMRRSMEGIDLAKYAQPRR